MQDLSSCLPEKNDSDSLTEKQNLTASLLLTRLWFSYFGLSISLHGAPCQLPRHISFTSALCHCCHGEDRQLREFPLLLPDIPLFTFYHFSKVVTLLSEVMESMLLRKLAVIYLSIVSAYHKKRPSTLRLGLRYLRALEVHGFPVF